ncbi:MAG: hypothetical protein IH946_05710 [Bacteroidetes bacterium]|nr:hypothetical protein [Bacteroidota bacterium]
MNLFFAILISLGVITCPEEFDINQYNADEQIRLNECIDRGADVDDEDTPTREAEFIVVIDEIIG